jgi:hypothetical protein
VTEFGLENSATLQTLSVSRCGPRRPPLREGGGERRTQYSIIAPSKAGG